MSCPTAFLFCLTKITEMVTHSNIISIEGTGHSATNFCRSNLGLLKGKYCYRKDKQRLPKYPFKYHFLERTQTLAVVIAISI